ncbi:MAG: DMT family transporter [Ignavibacteriae bacterium]|nr:MAG: DMT family transporter [Ignavibacteriota bacterium]
MRKLKAELILVFVALIWAGTFVVIKVTLTELPPFFFLAIRFFIAAAIFYIIFYKRISFENKDAVKAGIFLGFLLFLGFASQTSGMVYTTASNSALITGVNLLIIPFAQHFIIRKKVGIENWIGIIVVMFGLILLTRPMEAGLNPGDMITLICAFAWAFYIVYLDVYTKKYDLYTLVIIQFIVVSGFSLILALMFEDIKNVNINTISLLGLFYTAIPATLIATFLGNKYQKETTPIRAGLLFTFEQPAAVVLAVIFLHDYFNSMQMIGGILMICGIVFSESYEYIRGGLSKK